MSDKGRYVGGSAPFKPKFQPLGLGAKFDKLTGAELTRWAQRAGIPGISAELGRQAVADAVAAHLAKVHKDAGEAAVAAFLAATGAPTS